MESLGSVNRWAMDNMGPSVSRWSATAVMRASGLTAWSDAHKRAYGVTMMGSIGDVVRRTPDLRSLDDNDFRILKSKGVTEQDFAIWKLADQEDWGNGNTTMLTPKVSCAFLMQHYSILAPLSASDLRLCAVCSVQCRKKLIWP
jgi:hypothetical protein